MTPENIASDARNSISDYCIHDCKAFCCRKGYLILSLEEMNVIVGKQRGSLEDSGVLTNMGGTKFALNLGNPLGCPSLKNNLCLIHTDPKRHTACKEFPIFITDKKIHFSNRCPLVKTNKFYHYIHKFKKLGFTID